MFLCCTDHYIQKCQILPDQTRHLWSECIEKKKNLKPKRLISAESWHLTTNQPCSLKVCMSVTFSSVFKSIQDDLELTELNKWYMPVREGEREGKIDAWFQLSSYWLFIIIVSDVSGLWMYAWPRQSAKTELPLGINKVVNLSLNF